MNEYTAVGSQTPTYTDAGSLADDDTFTYKYDAHQHLIEVKQGATVIATYRYDALGLGRRTGKTVGAAVTRYVYAGQQAVEEYDGTGSGANLRRLYVFGDTIDQVVMMEAPDVADVDSDSNTTEVLRFSFHSQLIGSVSHVTGPAQSIVEQYRYDPYGKPTIKNASGSTISASAVQNPYLFTGRQLDEETGLYYYRARYYSPDLKRFVQRDPLEYTDGPNPVSYVNQRPTRARDPFGLSCEGNCDGTTTIKGAKGQGATGEAAIAAMKDDAVTKAMAELGLATRCKLPKGQKRNRSGPDCFCPRSRCSAKVVGTNSLIIRTDDANLSEWDRVEWTAIVKSGGPRTGQSEVTGWKAKGDVEVTCKGECQYVFPLLGVPELYETGCYTISTPGPLPRLCGLLTRRRQ
jgi:RHS repeat-associated protein